MLRLLTAFAMLLPVLAGGCALQANDASQWGTGQTVISPQNGPSYLNNINESGDMRGKR